MGRTYRTVLLAILPLLVVCIVGSMPASAAVPAMASSESSADDSSPIDEPEVDLGSPLASVRAFVELCRSGEYEAAAKYLDVPPGRQDDAPELARRLDTVMARRLPLEYADLSPVSRGFRDDGLAPNLETIGTIELHDGTSDPLELVRRFRPTPRWMFSRTTVARIDLWYGQLENSWLLRSMPQLLLVRGPLGIARWQWIVLPLLLVLALIVGWMLTRLVRVLVVRAVSSFDIAMFAGATAPSTMLCALGIVYATLPTLGVDLRVEFFVLSGLHTAFLVVVFWLLAGVIDISSTLGLRSPWAIAHPSGAALLPLARRILKVAIVAIAFVSILAELGYPVSSMLAGLGIGGLVLALAAQKTLENLFGAFAIGADQPFREGDYVRVDDMEGTVESIGLRSTRFRTLDRTLVTVPNGKLAEMKSESFAARDRMRMQCTVSVVYSTTPEQLLAVIAGCQEVLNQHPKIWEEAQIVRLSELASSSLDIEVMAWFQTTDWLELRQYRHEVLFGFMRAVHDAGTSFAFPTRTVHLAK